MWKYVQNRGNESFKLTFEEIQKIPIVINSKADVAEIFGILEDTKPTTKSGEIGTPVRVENIINTDFISKDVLLSVFASAS